MASSIGETAKLVASLELKDHFTPAAKKAAASLGKLESRAFRAGQKIGSGLQNAARNLRNVAIVAGAGIAFEVKQGLNSLAELETATTSVTGAIKQMGQAGQVTAGQVATWANEIETSVQAAFDDKEITAAASTLIRFGKVVPSNLRQSLVVMTDLAAKTGSVDSAASLLAKALADPTKAAGKLARSGVILTKEQQKTIKAMVKQGKTAQAQKFILDQLAKTTSGAAAASVGEYGDALNMLGDATEDAQRALAVGFLPIIKRVSGILTTELAKPSTIAAIRSFGDSLAGGLDSLLSIATKLPWGTIGQSLKIAGEGAKAVLNAFTSLPSWVQTAVITGWGLNKLTGGVLGDIVGELGKGLIKGVLGMNAGVVHINAGTVVGPGGVPGAPIPGGKPGGPGLIGTAARTILPVAIASIAVGAAGALADAIDPSARDPERTPLGQRDPRRFDKTGQVIQNSIGKLSSKVDETSTTQGEKTRSAFNAQAEKQKAAIAAAANKSTTDAERIKSSATINTLNSTSQIVGALGNVVTAVNGIDVSSTTITKNTVISDRGGPSGGSRDTDRSPGGAFGGH